MKWIHPGRAPVGTIGAGVASAALVLASLAGIAAPAQAADPAPVLSSTFDDGSYSPWVANGDAKLAIVDSPDGDGKSLEASGRTHAYDGVALDLTKVVQRDEAYTITFKARLADADQPAGGVHFTVDDGSYTWVSGDAALNADAWTTVTGTYTLKTGATPGKLYLDTSGTTFPDVLLDDITITDTGTGTGDTGGGTCTPTDAQTLVSASFDDSALDGLQNDGSSTTSFVSVDGNTALQVNGRANDFDGVQTAPGALSSLTAGQAVTLSAKVRLAGTTDATTSARLVAKPGYTWVGNTSGVAAGAWTTLTGTYTVPDGTDTSTLQVYVGTDALSDGTATYDYLVDDVTVAIPGTDCGGTGGDTCTYPTSDTIISSDFESGDLDGWAARDDGHGTATVAIADGGHDSDHALSVTNRAGQGQGVGHDVTCQLQPGVAYEFTGWVRFADGQPTDDVWLSLANTVGGSTTYSTLGQFTGITSTGWTQVTQKFTMPASDSALLYLETKYSSGQTGNTSDLLFDDLQVTKPAPAVIQDITPIKDTLPFPVGAAVSDPELVGAAGQLLTKHFGQVTPENTMKPEGWYDADHNFVTTNADADTLMDFAQQNGLRVYGHTLVWYQQTPDWFFQDDDGNFLTDSAADQQILRDRLKTHIDDVAKYLSGKWGRFGSSTNPLVSFDVVNEVVSDNVGDPEGLRQSHWYQVLGDEYITDAFTYANEAFNGTYADPSASHPVALFINDYNTEQSGKRGRLLDLVKNLIADGVPVDGVGHQFHVTMSTPQSSLKDAIEAFNGIQTADGHELYQAVTELDVPTGTPVTEANQIDQGYYYQGIFDMLRDEYAAGAKIFSATVWGLTDGQSWRASSGAPLLFDDDLQAKPAYYGVTDQKLPARQLSAIVFQQGASDVGASDDHATTDVEWSKLPLHTLGTSQTGFQLRWSADHLTAYVSAVDATDDATDAATFTYGSGLTATVDRDGTVTGTGVTAEVTTSATGWQAVVDLPVAGLVQGGSTTFDVAVTDGATTTGWNTPGNLGTLQLVEPLSYTTIPEASVAPSIDGTKDAVWSEASTVTTGKLISGAADGATATVYQLWKDNYLYVLADVTDPTVDSSSPNAYERDSVEIFTDPGNAKNGSYRPDDAQMRIGANGDVSFGTGDEAAQTARLTSASTIGGHGYVVEARIDLLDGNTGVGAFEGVDYEVNDGTAGARTSNSGWAEQTGTAYQTTSRWGVAQLVAPTPPPAVAPKVTTQPTSTTVALGATATLTAAASGSPTPTVRWEAKTATSFWWQARSAHHLPAWWTPVKGATSTTLTVTATATVDGTQYRAVFTNPSGTATTAPATVTVEHAKPVVTTQPRSASAASGSTVRFTAAATGYPAPTVSWQREVKGSHRWTTVGGAHSTTLAVKVSKSVDGARYRAVFTNRSGSATSDAATLSVTVTKPVITRQPSSVTARSGSVATFHVSATGTSVRYQWYVQDRSGHWVRAADGTSSTLRVRASSSTHVRVVVSNAAGSVTSRTATLSVRR